MSPDGGRLVLRAEYGTGPLWDDTRGGAYVDVPQLGLSPDLEARLDAWCARYDATLDHEYPPWSGFANDDDLAAFDREGIQLVEALMSALPGTIVTYQSDASVRKRR